MIGRLLALEARFDPLLRPYREHADRIMIGMNVFLFVVCLALTPYRSTFGVALAIGLPILFVVGLAGASAGRRATNPAGHGLRREGYEGQHVISLAQRIVQGKSIEEEAAPVADETKMPLIAAVRQMKGRLLDLLPAMPVAAAVIRIGTETVVNVNEAWGRTIGTLHDSSTRFGESPIWAEPATLASLMARMRQASEKLLDKEEIVLRKSDGTPILCELSLILHEDIVPVMAILIVEDVTLRRKAEQTMQRLIFRDMLTDLPNRVSLTAAMERAMAAWRQSRQPFALVMMDLDGFKPINNTYGHDAGDEVLHVIGAWLAHANRADDLTARLGGDEFVIVLNECPSTAAAAEVAQRCIKAVARTIRLDTAGVTVKVGASAGVAHAFDLPPSETDAEVLLKQADQALYAAKQGGKNRYAANRPNRPEPLCFAR